MTDELKNEIKKYARCIICGKSPILKLSDDTPGIGKQPNEMFYKCDCGWDAAHPDLQIMHEKECLALQNCNFIGSYHITESKFDKLKFLINKSKEEKRSLRNKKYRKSWLAEDISCEAIINWVSEKYPCNDFNVKSRKIRVISAPTDKRTVEYRSFQSIFKRKRETKQHLYLKWFAFNHFESARVEQDLYIPKEFSPEIGCRGEFLDKGHNYKLCKGERILTADVTNGFNRIIECGATTADSLVLPLLSYMANEVIWLPFQHKNMNYNWANKKGYCKAFSIKLKK